jgi:hypothetical protein
MNYELSNILFVFPYFIEISKNKIFLSWLITLPAGALMSILFFFTLKGVFGA